MKQELPNIYAELVARTNQKWLDLYARIFDLESFIRLPSKAIKSDGFVLSSLEASLWCFMTTVDFRSCVLRAVNLGYDSDTTAAIAGGLAGLYYRLENIPVKWCNELRDIKVIEALCI